MKTKQLITLLLIVVTGILSATGTYAGNNAPGFKGGIISGRVLDASTKQPMEYVNVAVFRIADSALITGTITDAGGQFKIEKIASGAYYLRITFLGFENLKTAKIIINEKAQQTTLGDIKLAANATELDAVAVVADRNRIEYQIDKRVINVGQDIVARGGTAVNVLENTPSVQVDPQGNVTLRGSSDFIVLIDGKPSVMKGSDALKSVNAAAIKQIEVITNPSAKYEADGKAGIINIIQKKDKIQGINGFADVSAGTSDKYSASSLINYRKKKVNVFAGIDYARKIYKSTIILNNMSIYETGNAYIHENVVQYNHNDNLNGKAGLDFDLDNNNSFSFSGSYGVKGLDHGAYSAYNVYNDGHEQEKYYSSNSDLDVAGKVVGLNLEYTHKFGENHTLSLTNTYSSWDGTDKDLVTEHATNDLYEPLSLNSSLGYRKDNFNYQYRFNADYKYPVKTGVLEAGIQYRYELRRDDLVFKNLDVQNNTWNINNMYTSRLNYDNGIYSGYATYSDKKWGISYMVGIRTEYFARTIKLSNDMDTYNYDKFMLYPSVHLTRSINENNQFQLSYSRRINRPQPWLLNKTPDYIDPNNIFRGNPDLVPEFTDAYELNYRLIYKIVTMSAQTYYRNVTNSFNIRRTLQSDGIMVHQQFNARNEQSFGMELGFDFNLTKWWQLSTSADFYHNTMDASATSTGKSKSVTSMDKRLISNISLKWGTKIQAVIYARGAYIDPQGSSSGFYTANIAISHAIMKGKLNLGISGQNIFNSLKFDYKSSNANYNNTYSISGEGRILQLTASYAFNNFKNKQRGRADDASFNGAGAF